MSKILVISAHQDLKQSNSNQTILKELEAHFGNEISVRRLSDLYPDFKINVSAEQEALVKADVIVFQYPTYWFNMPAILKKWLDDVWLYGFAYGEGGNQLKGKKALLSITTGSVSETYNGVIVPTIEDFSKVLKHSALYVGMEWQGVEALYGQLAFTPEQVSKVQSDAKAHVEKLIQKIKNLI